MYIFVDPFLGDIYVANSDSGGVSVINGKTNEAVAGVTFNVSPFGGGDIHCNINNKDLEAPINRFLYVSSGTKCIAKPSKGFEFSSWGEILEGNSTRTINETSGSPLVALFSTHLILNPMTWHQALPLIALVTLLQISERYPLQFRQNI